MTEPDIKDQYQEDCISWIEANIESMTSSNTEANRLARKNIKVDGEE